MYPRAALVVLVIACAVPLRAQTVEDGIMMPRSNLLVGDVYTHESWNEYWEGTLRRENGNIGTLTTRTNGLFANYGITDRLNVLANVPYVWTNASQGVLSGLDGLQDISLAAKYNVFEKPSSRIGSFRLIAIGAAGIPLTDYTPDFYPLSIGSASRRISARGTAHFQSRPGWFATGSTAYTWRGGVTLDRPYYYTDGRLFLTSEVDMPNVAEYGVMGGYMRPEIMAAFTFAEQRTLGGGDIRRQDAPFVSNRMNFTKVGGMVMAPVPKLQKFIVQFSAAYTIDGRNVGQATTFTTGLLYRLPFGGRAVQ